MTIATEEGSRRVTFLPEPEPREVIHPIISVDDHLVEPPWTFEGRVPKEFAEGEPRVIEQADGSQAWLYEGELLPNFSVHATVGRPVEEVGLDPARFEDMRRGCWDIKARVHDMDLNGVYASLNFPSKLAGFGGVRFSRSKDKKLGHALMRAFNSWHLEEWAGTFPDRIIACQVPWLADPIIGAEEIRRNATLGFTAVTFPDDPTKLGLPSLHSDYWDPFMAACADTDTVVCLHVGSGSFVMQSSRDAPDDTRTVLFPVNAIVTAVDWLYSLLPVRFPGLKIVLAEGGLSWVPMLLERLDYCVADNHLGYRHAWQSEDLPSDVLKRNFYFTSLQDPSGFQLRHLIGVDHIMVESDYPHADSTWPDTQSVVAEQLVGFPEDEIAAITHGNAARIFRHPFPAAHRFRDLAFVIWVVGAGGIGAAVAARLAAVSEVAIIDSWPEHIKAIRDDGLTLHDPDGETVVRLRAELLDDASVFDLPSADTVLLCTKSFQTVSALNTVLPLIAQSVPIVSLQNGLNEDVIAAIAGPQRTIGAVVRFEGGLAGPGHVIQKKTNGPLTIGELDGLRTPRVTELAELFDQVIPTDVSTEIWVELWAKLIRNCMLNPVAAISGLGLSGMGRTPQAREFCAQIARESVAVAQALDISVAPVVVYGADPTALATGDLASLATCADGFRALYEPQPDVHPSMLQDVLKGRATEIDHLNGAIAAKGQAVGVPTPFHDRAIELVHRIEQGDVQPSLALLTGV